MSDTINTIVDKAAFDQVSQLAAGVKEARLELIELIKVGTGQNKIKIQLPADLQEQLSKNTIHVQNLNKKLEEQEGINTKLQASIVKLREARKSSTKALTLEEKLARKQTLANERLAESQSEVGKEIQRTRAEAAQNNRITKQTETFYGKVSLKLKQTAQEYKELSLRKQLMGNLTEKEIQRMTLLEGRLDKYSDALMQADQRTGNYSRNVGNYKSGFDGLAMSMAQLTREGPAFAYSMQTGFLAISNNLPILVDEINNVRQANKALAAEGKKTSSVLSQVGSAIFSWQTAMSLGITLLTIYGKDLIDMAFGASKAEKAQEKLNESMAQSQADARNASQELRTLRDIVLDTTVSEEAREAALSNLKDEVTGLKDVELEHANAMQLVVDKTDEVITALEARAKASAFAGIAAEAEAELLKMQASDLEDNVKWYDYLTAAAKSHFTYSNFSASLLTEGAKKRTKAISEQEAVVELLNSKYKEQLELSLLLNGSDNDGPENPDDPAERAKVEAIWQEKVRETIDGTIASYEEQIAVLEHYRKELATTSKEHQYITETIDKLQTAISTLKNEFDVSELLAFDDEEAQAQLEGLQNHLNSKVPAAMENLAGLLGEDMSSLMNEFYDNYEGDYQSFLMFQAMKVAAMKESSGKLTEIQVERLDFIIGESQLMFNAIMDIASGFSERRIQQIEAEIEASERKYSKQLEDEKLTEDARAAIEAEAEERRLKLEEKKNKEKEKQAKIQKAQTAMNVVIQTSLAIISALAQVPKFDFGISAAAIAATYGAIGLAQLAAVRAQPLPQYKTGRKDGKEEWAILGDGGKHEPVTDKKGNLKTVSPNRPTIMKLDRGDRVFPSPEAFQKEYRHINDAAILTSLTLDQHEISAYEAGKVFDQNLLQQMDYKIAAGIKEGFRNIKIQSKNINNNDALLYELKKQRLRDV